MTARPYGAYSEALEALRPVLEAERSRGNAGSMHDGDHHDTRPWWQMRFPLDMPALEAEFEFGDRFQLSPDGGGRITLQGSTGASAFAVVGGAGGTWRTRRLRAAWWRDWTASPRARIRIENALPRYVS